MFDVFVTPVGRSPIGGYGARLITAGIKPGDYPRGGSTHLRIWAAERWANASGASSLAGATRVNNYARTLGVKVKRGVDLPCPFARVARAAWRAGRWCGKHAMATDAKVRTCSCRNIVSG